MTWALLFASGTVAALVLGVAIGRRPFCGCRAPRASQLALRDAYERRDVAPVCLSCGRVMRVETAVRQ